MVKSSPAGTASTSGSASATSAGSDSSSSPTRRASTGNASLLRVSCAVRRLDRLPFSARFRGTAKLNLLGIDRRNWRKRACADRLALRLFDHDLIRRDLAQGGDQFLVVGFNQGP